MQSHIEKILWDALYAIGYKQFPWYRDEMIDTAVTAIEEVNKIKASAVRRAIENEAAPLSPDGRYMS